MFFKLQILWGLLFLKKLRKRFDVNPERLQKKNWDRFQSTLKKSPFYSAMSDNALQMSEYPIMNKQSFMENFNSINTHNIDLDKAFELALEAEKQRDFTRMIGEVTVGLSSGTSGNRGVFLATEKERAQWVACVLDRVIGFSLKKRSVAFFLRANSNLYDSVKSKVLSFQFFDLIESLDAHIPRLNSVQPDFLVAQPSMLMELAKKVESGELNIQPQKIISVAEVLYPEDKRYLEKVFNQIIHQVYQCTEGFLASTCEKGVLHFHEDFLIIEKNFLDESKTRFHPIITDTMRSSQPIVRFELNDIIEEKKDCTCGRKTMAIEQIEGRSDDIIIFQDIDGKEIKIFPDFFRRAIVFSDPLIQNYRLIKRNQGLHLFIEGTNASFLNAEKGISELLLKYKIEGITIHREASDMLELGQKLRRIRNE